MSINLLNLFYKIKANVINNITTGFLRFLNFIVFCIPNLSNFDNSDEYLAN